MQACTVLPTPTATRPSMMKDHGSMETQTALTAHIKQHVAITSSLRCLARADRHTLINDEGSRVHENKTPTLRAHDNQAMILQARAVLPAPTVTRRRRLPRTRRSAPGSLALAFPSSLAQPLSPSRPRPLALSPSRPLALSCSVTLSLPHVLAPPHPLLLARRLLALSPALSPARSLALSPDRFSLQALPLSLCAAPA